MKPVCVDFETEGIEGRPSYPPKPVGVAILWPGKAPVYLAWGHPVENNCTNEQARQVLARVWEHEAGVLFHNAKFDLDVAEVHFDLALPSWQRFHDTMFLLFLNHPHAADLALKPSAERLLGLAPEERDAVADWLVEHQPLRERGVKISRALKSEHYWGKYICLAPAGLVGTYAIGDVERTAALFELLHPKLDEGMLGAYDRERRLLPHLLEMERAGVRVDIKRLRSDVQQGQETMAKLDAWIYARVGKTFNINSGDQLVAALEAAGKADSALLPLTKGGKRSTAKKSLAGAVTDPELLAVLKHRTQLKTCLSTFMEPWLRVAERSGGLIFTTWYQTRSMDGGTRTGRLSSSPNFQNIPKVFEPIFRDAQHPELPPAPWADLPPLPWVRSYVVPYAKGDVLIDRDYSQQEFRILAHYDGGEILQRYLDNPRMDFHEEARVMVGAILGYEMKRKPIKNMGFGLTYGMGIGLLAEKTDTDVATATTIKRAYLAAIRGIADMNKEMKVRAAQGEPIRTWGGRLYYCEPPRYVDGKYRTFEYKLLNVLIQGSAADCTKEAMIRYCEQKPKHHRLIITIHDEELGSVPVKEKDAGMRLMKETMESVIFDVPMLSDGKRSKKNWAEMEPLCAICDQQVKAGSKFCPKHHEEEKG
jgi:DNA polymerase-1